MRLLEDMTWEMAGEAIHTEEVFVIPVGSIEQHGPHCPVGTDMIIAETVARDAAEQTNAVCLPTVAFGVASHHKNFTGTVFVSETVFKAYVEDVIRSLLTHGCRKVLLVNGHGGNTGPLYSVIARLRIEFRDAVILLFEWWKNEEIVKDLFGEDASVTHACGIETSMIHACREETVDLVRAESLETPSIWGLWIAGLYMPGTTDEFSKTGAVGDMAPLSAEKGARLRTEAVKGLSRIIQELREFDAGSLA